MEAELTAPIGVRLFGVVWQAILDFRRSISYLADLVPLSNFQQGGRSATAAWIPNLRGVRSNRQPIHEFRRAISLLADLVSFGNFRRGQRKVIDWWLMLGHRLLHKSGIKIDFELFISDVVYKERILLHVSSCVSGLGVHSLGSKHLVVANNLRKLTKNVVCRSDGAHMVYIQLQKKEPPVFGKTSIFSVCSSGGGKMDSV